MPSAAYKLSATEIVRHDGVLPVEEPGQVNEYTTGSARIEQLKVPEHGNPPKASLQTSSAEL